MGNVSHVSQRRGYQMYECLDVGMFVFEPNAPLDSLVNQRIRLREYINYRMFKQPEGRLGVKTLPTFWLYDDDPGSLPIDIVDVYRPLDVAIASDARRMASRPQRHAEEQPATAWQQVQRAGGVASMWLAKLLLMEFHKPLMTVNFQWLRAEPEKAIDDICERLELSPTPRQRMAAVLHVEPEAA